MSVFANDDAEYKARLENFDKLGMLHRTCPLPMEGGNMINTATVSNKGTLGKMVLL